MEDSTDLGDSSGSEAELFEAFEFYEDSEAEMVDEYEFESEDDMLVDGTEVDHSPSKQDAPLYEGATITVSASYLMLFYFAKKYNLTLEAFEHLLGLVKSHCPQENKCASSVYKLKIFFNKLFGENSHNVLQYCSICCNIINGGGKCNTPGCKGHDIKPVQFYYGDLIPQIKKRMEDPEVRSLIVKDRRSNDDGVIRDIFDGTEYKKHVENGFLANTSNISLVLNTDGVAIFRSSKKGELWPLYLVINELPPKLRMSPKNMITCGLWCAPGKPNMQIYLRPLIDEVNKMYQQGFIVETEDGPQKCRAMLMLSPDDLPARALLTNMKNYNGESSCSTCHQKGETVPGNVLHRVWPFEPNCPLRTRDEVLSAVREVERTNKPCQGIKGASAMLLHQPFDIVKGFVVDYMHVVLLGVVPMLLDLWLGKESRGKPYYIGDKLTTLNNRLVGIKVPDCITRLPRKLEERQHWKANEFRAWLLHYSIPVLQGILPPLYLNHFSLLVWAIFTLLGDDIKKEDVERCQIVLEDFVQAIPTLYSNKSMTMKVHELLHIPLFVNLFGPLWAFSCFPYESANGYVKGFVHGTRYIASQIFFTLGMLRHRKEMLEIVERQDIPSDTLALFKRIVGEKQRTNATSFAHDITLLGAINKLPIQEDHRVAVNLFLSARGDEGVSEGENVSVFYRVEIKGEVYHSRSYTRVTARNTYTVKFFDPTKCDGISYGQVQEYLQRGENCMAIIKALTERQEPVLTPPTVTEAAAGEVSRMLQAHFNGVLAGQLAMATEVEPSNHIIAVDVRSIIRKCVFVQVGPRSYVSNIPNMVESD